MAQAKDEKQPQTPPPRRNRVAPIGGEAGFAGASAFAKAGFADPILVLRWPEIVGAKTARLATPLRFSESAQGGVLTLKTEPGGAVFLAHESPMLIARINSWLGRPAVARLRYVQSALSSRPKPQPPRPTLGPLPENDPAQRFSGPEALKTAILRLAASRKTSPGA